MSTDGTWELTMTTPMGDQKSTLIVSGDGATMTDQSGAAKPVRDFQREGDTLKWKTSIMVPMTMDLDFDVTVDGDALTGTFKPGMFPASPVKGVRAT